MEINKFVKYIFTFVLLLTSLPINANRIDYGQFSIDQLKDQATTLHPAGLYILANKLFKDDKKDDAVFWLTVGHLRFRFHLATKPNSTSLDGPSLFSTLQNFIGNPINEYAGFNPDAWVYAAKKAKQWDLDNSNGFTSKTKYKNEYAAIHIEMDDMINYINENKEKIQKDRQKDKTSETKL